MTFAPIALFVYNRLDVLKITVEALINNTLATNSELFIFADGPKTQNDEKVLAVREYIKTISGFKKIEIIESEINKGLANSVISGVTKIVNNYGKIIVLEDDIKTSPYFLKFMNEALDMYENEDAVACITGYTYPIKGRWPQTFLLKGADCWSWATWKRAWTLFEEDGQKLLNDLESKKLEKEFDFNNSYPYIQMLKDQIANKNSSWAIRWYASAFLRNKLCLYLGKSIVRNIGFVEDATHCNADTGSLFSTDIYNEPINLKKIKVEENIKMRKEFEKFFIKMSNKNKECIDMNILEKIVRIFFKKEKDGDRRTVKILSLIKIKYKKKKTQYDFSEAQYGFSGDYKSWDEVEKLCEGYSSTNILEKTLESTSKVKSGEAVFERDSFIFDKVQYSCGLLACLFKVAIENDNKLRVLDFGGSLGSHYFQNKEFLKPIEIESWTVVEQEHYVKAGNEKIADDILHFANSIDDVQNSNVLVLSSVLQYLPNPYEWLERFINKGIDYIIVDRTAFSLEHKNRLTLQSVPPEIYDAKYPAWFLDEEKFLSLFNEKYELIMDFEDGIDKAEEIPSIYKGYFFKKVKNA